MNDIQGRSILFLILVLRGMSNKRGYFAGFQGAEVMRHFYERPPSHVSIRQMRMAQWPKSTDEPNVY